MTQQKFESFRIKAELMDEVRTHILNEAVISGKTKKMAGMIREGIERMLEAYLNEHGRCPTLCANQDVECEKCADFSHFILKKG